MNRSWVLQHLPSRAEQVREVLEGGREMQCVIPRALQRSYSMMDKPTAMAIQKTPHSSSDHQQAFKQINPVTFRAPASRVGNVVQLSIIDPEMGLKPIEKGSSFPPFNYGALV